MNNDVIQVSQHENNVNGLLSITFGLLNNKMQIQTRENQIWVCTCTQLHFITGHADKWCIKFYKIDFVTDLVC